MAEELADQVQPGSIPVPEQSTEIEAEPKKLSLKEELTKNFNELREPKELRSKEPISKDVKASKAISSEDRPRDETGKFLPKDAVEAKAPAETAPKQDAPPATASAPPGLPPGWSPETKAFVNSLPPEHPLRMDVQKREKEVSDGFKKYSDDAKKYTEIEQVLAPVRQTYQQAGVQSDAEAIRRLLMWESGFRDPNTRIPAFLGLARQFGIDLASLAQNPGSNQTQTDANPQLQLQQYVQQAIQPVQSELQRLQSDRAASEIASFSKDKPYFEKVKTAMGQLMSQGAATDLDKAYQMATWNDPEIRAELIQKQLDEKLAANQQVQVQQQQKSQAARKAAVSPSTKAPAAPQLNGKDKSKGVRGSIMQAIESIREERA